MGIDRTLDRPGLELNNPRGLGDSPFGGPVFDDVIEALLPDLWFPFDDSSFATTIVDQGATGADLTSQNTVDASAGDPMRKSRSQSIEMPAFTNPNWATQAAHYTESADVINDLTTGNTGTFIFTVKIPASASINIHFFTMGPTHSLPSTAAYSCYQDTSGYGRFPIRGTTGNSNGNTSTTIIDDNVPHIIVFRNGEPSEYSTSALETWMDGNFINGPAFSNRSPKDVTGSPFNLGGQHGTNDAPVWNSDCLAYWNTNLTDEEVIAVQAAFLSDVI